MKSITVVAAIIVNDQKILCVQRGSNKYEYISHKWEFPGGKIEVSESKEQAILREIEEELRVRIVINDTFITVVHQYEDFTITMHSFLCSCAELNIQLTEHIDFKWLPIEDLPKLDWAADDIPIVNELIHRNATR